MEHIKFSVFTIGFSHRTTLSINIYINDKIHFGTAISNLDRSQNKYKIAKELKITPILDKILEYKKNWTTCK
jgi:hypothetical protein